jgi:hypothetical protein
MGDALGLSFGARSSCWMRNWRRARRRNWTGTWRRAGRFTGACDRRRLELGDALGLALGSTARESVAIVDVDDDDDDSRFLDACDGWRCLLSSIFQKKFWYKFPVVSSVGCI